MGNSGGSNAATILAFITGGALLSPAMVTVMARSPAAIGAAAAGAAQEASSYDPRRAGEPLPHDAIRPICLPTFLPVTSSGWSDDVLVIGVEIDGVAKAYPVSILNRREIVNDQLAQPPILVTW